MQNHESLTSTGFEFPELNVQFPEHEQLKCPRCDSSNTKFCYYNNYNLSQPRHFCKNCRRYWTKGGTLRNIPIGGGCRKNSKRSVPATSSKQQQQRVIQNPSTLIVTPSSLDSGVIHSYQSPSLKFEPGPIARTRIGTGSVTLPAESFTSLLGLATEDQFGNSVDGSGQNTGLGSDG